MMPLDVPQGMPVFSPWVIFLGLLFGIPLIAGGLTLTGLLIASAVNRKVYEFLFGRFFGVPVPVPLAFALGIPAAAFLVLSLVYTLGGRGERDSSGTAPKENGISLSATGAVLYGDKTSSLSATGAALSGDNTSLSATGAALSGTPSGIEGNRERNDAGESESGGGKITAAEAIFELIVQESVFFGICLLLLITAMRYGGGIRDFGLGMTSAGKRVVGWGIAAFFCGGSVMMIVQLAAILLLHALGMDNLPENPIIQLGRNLPEPKLLATIFIVAVIAAPLLEEFLFRGTLYPAFKSLMGGPAAAILTSVIFALVHPMINWAGIFVLSLMLIYLYERTGSLWSSIVLHATNNLITMLVMFAMLKS